jgi:hypothetical protein
MLRLFEIGFCAVWDILEKKLATLICLGSAQRLKGAEPDNARL